MEGSIKKQKRKLTHDAYTVGWVCVLHSELNASRAMLDEEHEQLESDRKDDNSYLLGQMGKHNVVTVFPGLGTYGTNTITQTVSNLLWTFPNIRFGLMVGVGGGVPRPPHPQDPRQDIRLGDVVVSDPKGKNGGVLQYDMGKWRDSRKFEIESHLNKPPKILLQAIQLLQSDHDFGEGEMKHYIREVAEKSNILPAFKAYRFPGRDQDLLFKADYRHFDGGDCSACDVQLTEKRLDRESDDPEVHYGIIASGNAVMRSAQRRDELRDAWNVSCFEMEAAGLMDSFPCIIIRGICDYSDNHKNKIWQPYSAVVAAAYAKDLLRVIQPKAVKTAPRTVEYISSSGSGALNSDCDGKSGYSVASQHEIDRLKAENSKLVNLLSQKQPSLVGTRLGYVSAESVVALSPSDRSTLVDRCRQHVILAMSHRHFGGWQWDWYRDGIGMLRDFGINPPDHRGSSWEGVHGTDHSWWQSSDVPRGGVAYCRSWFAYLNTKCGDNGDELGWLMLLWSLVEIACNVI